MNRIKEVIKRFRDAYPENWAVQEAKADVLELFAKHCQLFSQPLKVLVGGEWVEASPELKETVAQIDRSLSQPLTDKELREKLDKVKEHISAGRYNNFNSYDVYLTAEQKKQILALLQQKIEEARKEGYYRGKDQAGGE